MANFATKVTNMSNNLIVKFANIHMPRNMDLKPGSVVSLQPKYDCFHVAILLCCDNVRDLFRLNLGNETGFSETGHVRWLEKVWRKERMIPISPKNPFRLKSQR